MAWWQVKTEDEKKKSSYFHPKIHMPTRNIYLYTKQPAANRYLLLFLGFTRDDSTIEIRRKEVNFKLKHSIAESPTFQAHPSIHLSIHGQLVAKIGFTWHF